MRRSFLRDALTFGSGVSVLIALTVTAGAQQGPMQLGAPLPPPKPVAAQPSKLVVPAKFVTPGAPAKPAAKAPAAKVQKAAVTGAAPRIKAPKPDAAAARIALLMRMTGQDPTRPRSHVFEPVKPTTCPGNPDAIGVSRVMKVDTEGGFYVGQTYHTRLPLEPKEVVLTFDDGPMAGRTERVLEALDKECTKASFFIVGQMARAYPETLRKTAAAGHTIGYHTMTHPLNMVKWPLDKAQGNIRDGWQTVDQILYGTAGDHPATPFFRYPGLFNSRAIDDWLNSLDMGVWAIDAAGNDWLKGYITLADGPNVMNRALAELEARQGGILLLHDIKESSSSIVGPLLRELKKRGFHIVHIVPKKAPPQLIAGPIKGVIPTVAETTVPVEQRAIDGFDAAKQLAQNAAGRTGKTSPAALPTYETARPPVSAAAPAVSAPAVTETTGSTVPRARAEDGWFSSTAASFRSVTSAIGF